MSSISFINIYRFKSVHNMASKYIFITNIINKANADIIIFFITWTTVFCHYIDHWIYMCAIWALQSVSESLFFKFLKFGMNRWRFSLRSTWQKLRNSRGYRSCLGYSWTSALLFCVTDIYFLNQAYGFALRIILRFMCSSIRVCFLPSKYTSSWDNIAFSAPAFRHSFLFWLYRTKNGIFCCCAHRINIRVYSVVKYASVMTCISCFQSL
jgi:hypothetical protein